jgi:RNA polymerase sigma factor (sigma-70 family)
MDWAEIYGRLQQDANDLPPWTALERQVHSWARLDLWTRGTAVVDDVVADTCASVLLGLVRARGAATFAGFVRGHYLNARRQAIAAPPTQTLDDYRPDAHTDHTAGAVEDHRWEVVEGCLERLPPRERIAVDLRYFEEASAERIAAVLDVGIGNARRIVFNGLARLRQCVRTLVAATATD